MCVVTWPTRYRRRDTQPPSPVTNLTLSRTSTSMNLSWTNPSTPDFSGTMIRVKVGSPPSGPTDGALVVDQCNTPGTSDNFTHAGINKGIMYCYAAFAHDLVAPKLCHPCDRVAGGSSPATLTVTETSIRKILE